MYNKDQKQKHLVTILKGKIYHNTLQWNNGVGGRGECRTCKSDAKMMKQNIYCLTLLSI